MALPKFRFAERVRTACTPLLFGFFLVACQSGEKLNPNRPKEAYSVTNMDVRNERFLSTANVPVSISMADVERQINAQVNGLIYEGSSADDPTADSRYPYMTRVWKRAPIKVQVEQNAQSDSLFRFDVPLKIWAKAGITVLGFTQYKETEFTIDLHFATRFSIDPDWSISTHTQATGYDWVTKPNLRLVGFNVPITRFVGRLIDKNLGTITQTLDQQVRKNVDLRTPVLNAWNTLRQPYLLSEQYRTYLMVVPKRVLITPLRFSDNFIRSSIGIEGYTLTTIGTRPDVHPAVTLPDLVVVNQVKDEFQVGLLGEATYEEAAKLATAELVGKSYSFRNGQYTVTITNVDLYGQDDNLIVKAGLRGSIDGHIYLRGQPYYNPETQSVSLRNLTYDLETRNLLQRTASWLLQGTLARTMEKQLTFPVGQQLAEAQQAIQERLKNNHLAKGVILNGHLDEIRPDQVYLTPTSLLAVVYARGHLNVTVDGL